MFENDSGVPIKKDESDKIEEEIIINENIEAPVEKGKILGKINYNLNGETISTVNLVAENSISKKSLLNMFTYISSNWLNLLR